MQISKYQVEVGFPVDMFDSNFSNVDSAVKSTQKSDLSQFHHQNERSVKYQLYPIFLSFYNCTRNKY